MSEYFFSIESMYPYKFPYCVQSVHLLIHLLPMIPVLLDLSAIAFEIASETVVFCSNSEPICCACSSLYPALLAACVTYKRPTPHQMQCRSVITSVYFLFCQLQSFESCPLIIPSYQQLHHKICLIWYKG